MLTKPLFTLQELADELQIDEATIRNWQDQFDAWIPYLGRGREKWYPDIAMDVLRFIKQQVDGGRNEEEIEGELKDQHRLLARNGPKRLMNIEEPCEDLYKNPTAAQDIQGILESINAQNKCIADAQKKRIILEERIATAIEKQNQNSQMLTKAIEEMVNALKNLAGPLSSTANHRPKEKSFMEQVEPSPTFQPDDPTEWSTADALIDSNETDSFTDHKEPTTLDDSLEPPKNSGDHSLESTGLFPLETDDLVDLIEPLPSPSAPQTENLAEPKEEKPIPPILETDDLADLIEPITPPSDGQIKTLEHPRKESEPMSPVSAPKPNTTAVPDDYKSKMIAVIIGMKEKQKLSIADTVERLNKKGYKTLSGEAHWTPAAIEQIYQHIDIVQVSRKLSA